VDDPQLPPIPPNVYVIDSISGDVQIYQLVADGFDNPEESDSE
jgi:hypothetical protein